MVTYTSTYNLKLPVVGQDDDAWGGYINDNTNALESLLTGNTTITSLVITTADINGGTLDNVVIGGTTAAEITGTTITGTSLVGNVTGNVSGSSGSTTGNAATATALATARDIGGVSFNGSASINLPGVNTSGNQDTSGNAATATTAGTVTTAAQPNITSVGTLTTLTVDDITINGSAISDSGDFYIDVGGDIILDADGADVRFRDAGTEHLKIFQSSGDVVIASQISDKDMKFNGTDGGSGITALTLDFSEAGAAIFNAGATFGGAVDVTGNITVSGTVDGVDIAGNIDQAVKTTSSPTFNNLNVQGEIYHSGDTDTYIEFTGNTVKIFTGGSERFRVDNGGFEAFNGNLDMNGNIIEAVEDMYLRDKIFHDGDTDTSIGFNTDQIELRTGGNLSLHVNGSGTFVSDGSLKEQYVALSGTTPTCNVDNGGMFSLTMSGNTTFTFSGADTGYSNGFILQLTGNGGTVTYPNTVRWAGGSAPDAPANSETDILVFVSRDGGSNWYGVLSSDAAS